MRIADEWKQAGLGENEFTARRVELEGCQAQERRRMKRKRCECAEAAPRVQGPVAPAVAPPGPLLEELSDHEDAVVPGSSMVSIAVDDGGSDRLPTPLEGGASICMLPGCTRPRFVDGLTGHATCSRSHHAALVELQAAAAAIATAAAAPVHPPAAPPPAPPPPAPPPAQPPPAPPAPPPPAPAAPVAPAEPAAQPAARYMVGNPRPPPRHSAFGFTAQQLSGTGYTASASSRVSDGAGGISTVYTFTGHADALRTLYLDTLTGTCGARGALLVATAPAGAVLLGGCLGHTYWIADGAIVRTVDAPPVVVGWLVGS